MFPGVQKETSGMKWVNENINFVFEIGIGCHTFFIEAKITATIYVLLFCELIAAK